jgi:glycosyltransferase involved in cell wall biosynthesis
MNKLPVISVIIAAKNSERFIATSIESVISTDYPRLEILVVDGSSTDQTCKIVKKYSQVKLLSQTGSGIASAYNKGIALAQGELIGFNSSDDIWCPDKLTLQLQLLNNNLEAGIAAGKVEFFLEEASTIPLGFRRELLDAPRIAYIMETVLIRRELFDRIGEFDTSLGTAEDVDWFARARDGGVISLATDAVVVKKRIHDENSSLAKSNTAFLLAAVRNSIKRKEGLANLA